MVVVVGRGRGRDRGGALDLAVDRGFSSRTAVVDNERTVLGARKREDWASASVAKERHASRRMEGSRAEPHRVDRKSVV